MGIITPILLPVRYPLYGTLGEQKAYILCRMDRCSVEIRSGVGGILGGEEIKGSKNLQDPSVIHDGSPTWEEVLDPVPSPLV